MDSIKKGLGKFLIGSGGNLVDRIRNCRHEISVWRKFNLPYGKERINDLQKALEKVQNDSMRDEIEVRKVVNKLKEAYRDEN